jgi:hypothetical protein
VIRDADGRIILIRYVLPRHKAANWVGPSRSRKSTRPGANGVVDLSRFEFLDRLVLRSHDTSRIAWARSNWARKSGGRSRIGRIVVLPLCQSAG